MNTTNIFKQFIKNTVGKFTRIKFTKNGTIRKITGIAAIISIMAGTTACGNRTEAVITDDNEDITSYKEYATVEESKASKFQYTDLTINSLKYMMTEEAVKNIYGTPVSEYESTEKDTNAEAEYLEKVCSYNDLTLIFVKFTDDGRTAGKNENGTYKLTAAASVSDKDVFSRGLKVGMSVDSILSVYYRDQDYKNKYIVIVGLFVIITSILYFGLKIYNHYNDTKNNDKAVEAVLNKKIDSLDNLKYRYKAVLEIPSIKLKRGILDIDNKYNKAKYNIELIKEKDDIIVLASHNGNNYNSYFGNLKNISLGDTINYYYDGKIYKYIYTDSYDIKKDGYADIYRKKGNKCIVLVTCKDGRNDGQTVFIGYLDEILEY